MSSVCVRVEKVQKFLLANVSMNQLRNDKDMLVTPLGSTRETVQRG